MSGKIDPTHELRIRFSLAALIIAVTLCGLVLAILRLVGPLAAIMTTVLLTAVAAHIVASYLGHRLGLGRKQPLPPPDRDLGEGTPKPNPQPRPSPNLAERSNLAVWQRNMIAQVSIAGAVSGGMLSARLPPEEFNHAVLAVSILSSAALGGMISLLLVSFVDHAWRSIREASAEA